ncbi:hypothetical protein BDV18DRAFT_156522 [Aspergillus unguis]
MHVLPVGIAFVSVSTIVVALRLFTRIRLVSSPGWDDWFLLLALVTDYACFGVMVVEDTYGLGKPESTVPPDVYRAQLKMLWISVPLYNLCLNLTKVSVVFLYLRLFTTRTYQIILKVLLVFIVISAIYMVLGTLLVCIPVSSFWNQDPGHCVERAVIWYLNAALQIAGDLVLVILPMPQLWIMRIPAKQKVCLIAIFALGLIVCATSAARFHSLVMFLQAKDYSRTVPSQRQDNKKLIKKTGQHGILALTSILEANVAILCASLPTFRQLMVCTFPRLFPSSARKKYGRRGEKRLHGSAMVWEPYQGPASYCADVSVSADYDSVEHVSEGIQVIRELRWEMGSADDDGLGVGLSGSKGTNTEPEKSERGNESTSAV